MLYEVITDPKWAFSALDELLAARIVSADAERCRFTQRGFLQATADALTPERGCSNSPNVCFSIITSILRFCLTVSSC